MKKILLPILAIMLANVINAQVGIGTVTPNTSSQLEIVSSNKGVLFPQVALTSSTDNTSITNGNVNSLFVYNTATASDVVPGYYYWNGTKWTRLTNIDDIAALVAANEVDGTIGNEVTNATLNGGLNRSGTGTTVSPFTLGLAPGNAVGDVLTWNGTSWVSQTAQNSHYQNKVCNTTVNLTLPSSSLVSMPGITSYTAPRNGRYELIFHSFFRNNINAGTKSFYVSSIVNGVIVKIEETYAYTASYDYINVHYPVVISANAGDVISIEIQASVGGPFIIESATANRNNLDIIYLGL